MYILDRKAIKLKPESQDYRNVSFIAKKSNWEFLLWQSIAYVGSRSGCSFVLFVLWRNEYVPVVIIKCQKLRLYHYL